MTQVGVIMKSVTSCYCQYAMNNVVIHLGVMQSSLVLTNLEPQPFGLLIVEMLNLLNLLKDWWWATAARAHQPICKYVGTRLSVSPSLLSFSLMFEVSSL